MPQIANQDYIYIKPKYALLIIADAVALAELKTHVERGTIWDCILNNIADNEGEGFLHQGRVLGVYWNKFEKYIKIYGFDASLEDVQIVELLYTITQYEGLAAIQEAESNAGIPISSLPTLGAYAGGNYLGENTANKAICVNGYYLTYTIKTNVLESLVISDEAASENFINIAWEDAQKLIGLPIQTMG